MRRFAVITAVLFLGCSSPPSGVGGASDGGDDPGTGGDGGSMPGGSGGTGGTGGTGGNMGAPDAGSNTGGSAGGTGGGDEFPADGGPIGREAGSPQGGKDGGTDGDVVGDGGGVPATGSGCAGKSYKFCEDFEGGGTGLPTGWTGGSTVVTDQFHSGSKALRSSQSRIQKSLASLGPALSGTHWGRIFFKVQSPAPTAGGVLHTTFVSLNQSRVVDTVEDRAGKVQFLYNLPDDSCCRGSSYNWRFDDQWHCAEWYVNAETRAYRFFYDTVENTQIGFTGNARSRLTTFTSISVGVTYYQRPSRPFVAWMDDLAINDTRIGCGP